MDAYQKAKEAKKRRETAVKGGDTHGPEPTPASDKTAAASHVTDKDIANAALYKLGYKDGYQAGYMAGRRHG